MLLLFVCCSSRIGVLAGFEYCYPYGSLPALVFCYACAPHLLRGLIKIWWPVARQEREGKSSELSENLWESRSREI